MARILLLGSGGIGDFFQTAQCSKLLEERGHQTALSICARDEVANPLLTLLQGDFDIEQHPDKEKWGDPGWLFNNLNLVEKYKEDNDFDEAAFVVPDLLFNSPLALDLEKYGLSLQAIRSTRVLTSYWNPDNNPKIIYLALTTSTINYDYPYLFELINELAAILPDYTIYFPNITKWNDTKVSLLDSKKSFLKNVKITTDEKFSMNLDVMSRASYAVCLDNGPSHIFWNFGCPRLLLDPQYGRAAWMARWRQDFSDSIDLRTHYKKIAQLVKTNLLIPQTQLIPRQTVLDNLNVDWKKELIFKY